jgi:hypothetical protein
MQPTAARVRMGAAAADAKRYAEPCDRFGLAASHFPEPGQVEHQTRSIGAQSVVAYRFNTERARHREYQLGTFNIEPTQGRWGGPVGFQFPAGPSVSRPSEACLTRRAVDGGACDDGAAATDGKR